MHQILEILEESTDSAGPDLISLDDLKAALGIEGNTEDAALQSAITFQSRIIADYCNRRFGMAEALETFTFDPFESPRIRESLVLSLYPVSEIFEVSIAGATAADVQFDPASGRVWIGHLWNYGGPYYGLWGPVGGAMNSVAISYSGGYDLPEDAPARLQRAVIECVASVRATAQAGYRDPTIREVQHGDTRISYVSPSFASGAISTGQHLSPSVADLIKPYRRMYIA
jgi:hypothetical protein